MLFFYFLAFLSFFSILTILAVKYPNVLLYFFVFFYPAIAFLISIPIRNSYLQEFFATSIDFPLVDLLALVNLYVLFINFFYKYLYKKDKKWKIEFPAKYFFLLFIFSALLSLINSGEYFLLSLKYLLRPMAFAYIAYFLTIYNLIKNKKTFKNVLDILLLLSLIAMLMGAFSLNFIIDQQYRVHPLKIFSLNLWGENQHLLAELYIFFIPLLMILYILEKRARRRMLLFFMIILMIFFNFLTFSRTAWLASFLFILIIFIFQFKKYIKQYFKYFIPLIIFFIPILFLMYKYSFFSYTALSSNWGRLEMTEFAYFLFLQAPFIGNGVGTYYYRLSNTRIYTDHLGTAFDAHGILQKLLSEGGLLLLFSFFLFLFFLAYPIWQNYKLAKNEDSKLILLLLGNIVILAIFYQFFSTNYYSIKMFFPIAIALVFLKFYDKKEDKFLLE